MPYELDEEDDIYIVVAKWSQIPLQPQICLLEIATWTGILLHLHCSWDSVVSPVLQNVHVVR